MVVCKNLRFRLGEGEGGKTITALRLVGVERQIIWISFYMCCVFYSRESPPRLLSSFLPFFPPPSLHSLAHSHLASLLVQPSTAMPKQQSGPCCRHRGNAKPCLHLGGDPLYKVQDLALPTCPPVKPPPRLVRCRAPCVSRLNLSMVQSRAEQQPRDGDVHYTANLVIVYITPRTALANECARVPCSKPARGSRLGQHATAPSLPSLPSVPG